LFEKKLYSEIISSILISVDGKNIVVLGKDFHYIFDAPSDLVKILSSPLHKKVEGNLYGFSVNGDNIIKWQLALQTKKRLSARKKKISLARVQGKSRGRVFIKF
jgi:hypothetical protein